MEVEGGDERLQELSTVLRATVERAWTHRHAYRLEPFTGSQAARETAETALDSSTESYQTATSAALMRIVATEDALQSISDQLTQRRPFTVGVLSRSVLEWCALARWICDTAIDRRERLARGMTDYLYSLWEVWRLTDGPAKTHYLDRMNEEIAEEARTIAIDDEIVDAFRSFRKAQTKEYESLADHYQGNGLVFCRADGTPHNPEAIAKMFDKRVKKAGLLRIRFHDLRHTHATLALQAGVHPKVVQERLGHSSIAITLDTYSHVVPSMQQDAATAIGKFIRESQ